MDDKIIYYLRNSILKGLTCNENIPDGTNVNTIAETRGTSSIGDRYFCLQTSNNAIQNILETIRNIRYMCNISIAYNFKVDSRFLKNQAVLDFIRDMRWTRSLTTVTITDPEYSIKLKVDDFIDYVNINFNGIDSLPDHLRNDRNNCEICPSFFCTDYGYDYNMGSEESYFIKRELNDEEIAQVIEHINFNISKYPNIDLNHKLYIRFFEPERYASFIKRLYDRGLNKTVNINILAYPLEDSIEQYEALSDYASNIEVSYMSCKDLIDEHCNEPYVTSNRYRSELEADGITNLMNYINILNYIREFETHIRLEDDDLTKAVAASQFMKERFEYDPEADVTDSINPNTNRAIDSIVNRDYAVCEGFANLFSLLLRRVNVPVFVYGTHEHARNIGRIRRKDENGNVIEDKICTFDFTHENNNINQNDLVNTKQFNYRHFALSPDAYLCGTNEYLTLANSLIVDRNSYENNRELSVDTIEAAYSCNYEPLGYLYSMLRIMGYGEAQNEDELFELIRQLNNADRIGSIDEQAVVDAVTRVIERNGTDFTQEEIESEVKRSIDNRIVFNNGQPHILSNGINPPRYNGVTASDLTDVNTYNNRVYTYIPFSQRINDIQTQVIPLQPSEPAVQPTVQPVVEQPDAPVVHSVAEQPTVTPIEPANPVVPETPLQPINPVAPETSEQKPLNDTIDANHSEKHYIVIDSRSNPESGNGTYNIASLLMGTCELSHYAETDNSIEFVSGERYNKEIVDYLIETHRRLRTNCSNSCKVPIDDIPSFTINGIEYEFVGSYRFQEMYPEHNVVVEKTIEDNDTKETLVEGFMGRRYMIVDRNKNFEGQTLTDDRAMRLTR